MKAIISAMIAMAVFAGTANATEVDSDELRCLSMNIYHESRGESIIGQRAVAFVTLNRVENSYFPDTVCGVVWQNNQFAWTQDGASDRMNETEARNRAERIARNVLSGVVNEDPTDGSLFFHTTNSRPSWVSRIDYSTTIGVHHFYTWDGNWNND